MRNNGTAAIRRTKEDSYEERVRKVLGHHLSHIEILNSNTKHPQIGVEYVDYKPSCVVRKELEEAMPEVDFFRISREYSNAALVTALMSRDEGWVSNDDIKVLTTDNRVMSMFEYMWDLCYERDFTDLSWQRERYSRLPDWPQPENQQQQEDDRHE